jgi:NAD(P)-dependent dehydrogenase (short-subunit alcohol dehydrogenase family)
MCWDYRGATDEIAVRPDAASYITGQVLPVDSGMVM